MKNTYDFPVALKPVYLGNEQGNYDQIPNKQAVVRTDTMDTLGIVSTEYGLVKHSSVVDSFREAGKKYHVSEKVGLTNNGAQLFYQMTFPKVETEVSKGDIIRMMMIVKNSYNSMNSLQVVFGAFRLVCTNGLIIGTKFISFHYKHIGNVGGFSEENLSETLQLKDKFESYIDVFGKQAPMLTAMTKKSVVPQGDILFDSKKVNLPNYLLQEAKQSFEKEKDQSVWGYYNSLTYAITHKLKKQNPNQAIDYGTRAWKMAEQIMN